MWCGDEISGWSTQPFEMQFEHEDLEDHSVHVS